MNYGIRFHEIDLFFKNIRKTMKNCDEHWETLVKWGARYAKQYSFDQKIVEYILKHMENMEIGFGIRTKEGKLIT